MKKVYLPLLLMFTSIAAFAQESDKDKVVIEREVLGIDNLIMPSDNKRMVIGAVRSNKPVEEQPLTIFEISHDEIVRNGYITLADVLKMVPGFRVSQPQSGELGEAFMQRGLLGNTYTKILINGKDTKPYGNYGMPLGANLPIRQAEKISIVYGPQSASYGNDACVGVINITTKVPDVNNFTSADVMMGSGDISYLNFHSGATIGHGKYVSHFSIYGSHERATDLKVPKTGNVYNKWNFFMQNENGQEPLKMQDPSDGQYYTITNDMINPYMFTKYQHVFSNLQYYFVNYEGDFYYPEINEIPQEATMVGAELNVSGLTFTYNMSHRMDFADLGQSPFTYNYQDSRNTMGEFIHRFTGSADYKFGDLSTSSSVRYICYRMDKNSSRGVNWNTEPQYAYAASDEIAVEENLTWDVFKNEETKRNLTLYSGASFQYLGVLAPTVECERKFDFSKYKPFSKTVNYEDEYFLRFGINPEVSWQTGAYVLAELDLNRIQFSANTRYDYNSIYKSSWNPRFSVLYKITEDSRFTVRASSGWAYKTPSPAQIYYCVGVAMPNAVPGVPLTVALHHIPSDMDSIKAERIWSNEIGLRCFLDDRKKNYLELVGYTNLVKDPLVRAWVKLNESEYPLPYYVGVTDLFSNTKGRSWTRAYKNESGMETKIYGLQAIAVFRDLVNEEKFNFGLSGAYTYTRGHEYLSDNNAGDEVLQRVDYVRHTPSHQAQLSLDFNLFEFFHLRVDNIYCSEFHRMYFQATENPYFMAPDYYNLDLLLSGRIGKHLTLTFKMNNVTDALYGGIDVKNMDVDLPFNPQYGRTVRFGVSYNF